MVGILGYPVDHSLSPPMHNAAFQALGLDWVYVPFPVRPEALESAVHGLVACGVRGFNVTVPHKVAVMKHLDEIDNTARIIGAVNTVVINSDGRTRGYNTDADGFIRSLYEESVNVKGTAVLIIGAGGAARAIACGMLREGAREIVIGNRTQEKARNLAEHLKKSYSQVDIKWVPLTNVPALIPHCDIIVNATSLGMKGQPPLEIDLSSAKPDAVICDIVYSPIHTEFLSRAREKGLKIITGDGMLLHQGTKAFELWTGHDAPVDVMRRALNDLLNSGS